jgi:Ser/Thr protein kinase RdoA (MazF antagonist)
MESIDHVATQFASTGSIAAVQPYGSGNVNDTFLVSVKPAQEHDEAPKFILQRINTHVFRQPKLIVANMRRFTDHVQKRLTQENTPSRRRWESPIVIATRTGQDYWIDEKEGFWRAITLIEGAKTHPSILDATHAQEAGYALGRFQSLISDLDTNLLHDTLPGFHITPHYLTQYDAVLVHYQQTNHRSGGRTSEIQHCLQFVETHRKLATILADAQGQGRLSLRAIHGDPKVDNILIDDDTHEAIGIVDLDTVKPGLVHYDVGDCLRSCCNPAGEETTDLSAVHFDTDLCQVILDGYFEEARRFFTPGDYAYLFDSIRLIAFELGLRFFTDFLAGDVYFRAKYPEHNLNRALVQFKVAEQVEAQEATIRKITDVVRR